MLDNEFIVFDLETTDAALGTPNIVEIGGLRVSSDFQIQDTFESFVQPPDLSKFTRYSQELTGISEQSISSASQWDVVWRQWAEFTAFKKHRLFSWTAFDSFVLRSEYYRLRLEYAHSEMPICIPSMVYLYAANRGWSPRSLSLKSVANEFGIEVTTSHRALNDAVTACKVLRHICGDISPGESDTGESFKLYEV